MNSEQNIFKNSKKVWEENLKLFPQSRLHFPDENLVRLFSGHYVYVPPPPAELMDHGFGHGNNLAFFASKGYSCAGCEISDFLIDEVNGYFSQLPYPLDLRPIRGLKIPFEDNRFDIIVSWNVIHYSGTRDAVIKVIEDLHRLLKPGGVLLLSTLAPENSIFERMKSVGNGSYFIEKESLYDNRLGLTFFAASSEEELIKLFDIFSNVKIGKVHFDLFNSSRRHACSLVYGVK